MIKEKELRDYKTVRFQEGKDITLTAVQTAIKDCADKYGISLAFAYDEIKHGGMFGDKEDCLVMYNPNHVKDYIKFCIRIKKQGQYAFIYVSEFGLSKNGAKNGGAEGLKAGLATEFGVGGLIAGQVIGGMFKAKRSAVEEETMFYACVGDILDEIVS